MLPRRGRVVITGAGGFIGHNLARSLAAAGWPLLLIALRDDPWLRELPGAELVVGPAAEVLGEQDLGGACALVHLASRTNPRVGDLSVELQQLEELAIILEEVRPHPGLQLLFPSSGGTVYADAPHPHREDEPLAPADHYGWGKAAAELLVAQRARAAGQVHRVLRCGNAYGPWQVVRRQGLIMKLLEDLSTGGTTTLWGDGEERRDYVFVEDLCRLVEAMLRRPDGSGVYNVGSGQPLSTNEVVEAVARVTGLRPRVCREAGRAGPRCSALDPGRAAREFGWSCATGLDDGIRATWSWLQEARAGAAQAAGA